MDNSKMLAKWQNKIAQCCEEKLGRRLSPAELDSIRQYEGFLALEMIEDTVSQAQPNEIEQYLASIAAT